MADKYIDKKSKIFTSSVVVCIMALICTFLWGSAFPCVKIGYRLFSIDSGNTWAQVLFAGIRFALAGILTVIIGSVTARKILVPRKSSIYKIVIISLFQTILQYIFFYCGLARTSSVKSSIIEGSSTFFAIIVSSLVFRYESLNIKKIIGCILGFSGVIIVNITPAGLDMNMKFMGEGFILISTIAYAVSSSVMKKYSQDENPVMLSGYQFIFGGIVMMIMSKMMGGNIAAVNKSGVLILLYLAFVSAAAYSLWGILLKYNPVSRVTVYSFMVPAFGVILSAIWLGESVRNLGYNCIISLVLVCVGVWIVNKTDKTLL